MDHERIAGIIHSNSSPENRLPSFTGRADIDRLRERISLMSAITASHSSISAPWRVSSASGALTWTAIDWPLIVFICRTSPALISTDHRIRSSAPPLKKLMVSALRFDLVPEGLHRAFIRRALGGDNEEARRDVWRKQALHRPPLHAAREIDRDVNPLAVSIHLFEGDDLDPSHYISAGLRTSTISTHPLPKCAPMIKPNCLK